MAHQGISLTFHLKDGNVGSIVNFYRDDVNDIVAIDQRASPAPWSKQNYLASIDNSHICVGVKIDNQWIAHAVFSLVTKESELLILAVDVNWQKKGVATQLIMQMEHYFAKYAEEMFLEVRSSNESAINLYEKLGFNCVGERKNYYPAIDGSAQREDALIYGKYIAV